MSELFPCKKCTLCNKQKPFEDYYLWHDKHYDLYRQKSECKACTQRTINNRRRRKARDKISSRSLRKREYQKEYMKNNKAKMNVYRARFHAKNPHYYRDYMRKKRQGIAEAQMALKERDIA